MRGALIGGWAILLALVGFLAGWGGSARIDTTVMANGIALTDPPTREVHALLDGNLSHVLVAEGQHVAAGEVLLTIDTTELRTRAAYLDQYIAILRARQDRLTAESHGAEEIATTHPRQAPALADEAQVFAANRDADRTAAAALTAQVRELEAEATGARAEHAAILAVFDLLAARKSRAEPLVAKGVLTPAALDQISADMAEAQGQLERLSATIARTRAAQETLRARIDHLWSERRQSAATELAALAPQMAAAQAERADISHQLTLATLRAPISGTVQLFPPAHAGQVVAKGQKILAVIPSVAEWQVEAQIAPDRIAQVAAGQTALGWLAGSSGRSKTPVELTLQTVSADRIATDSGGYYAARFNVTEPDPTHALIKAGQPVSVVIRTGRSAPIAYLTGPLAEYLSGLFRSG